MSLDFLWYIPNTVEPGHRGDDTTEGWGSLDYSTGLARAAERHGWSGALIGTSWGRPDTFTVATALAARTTTFRPLVAVRPGYWHPAQFAAAAATLDQLSQGRALVNIVSGLDQPAAYGDDVTDSPQRYARTQEFMHLVRRLWTEPEVTFEGRFYRVTDATLAHRPYASPPPLYFGGASPAAERVAAAEADVQLFWGEPLEALAERIARLRELSADRVHAPLEFGLRITTLVRDTTQEAWAEAEARVARMRGEQPEAWWQGNREHAVGQRRLYDLAERGEVLDTCLYTTPGTVGGGGAGSTWLVGSPTDVAQALLRYRGLGITRFILSDTPYQREIRRLGEQLLPLLREPGTEDA
ncbi:LLM class flavin-dependent oxidoreductase [Kineosporia sp. J2-2]|uniref:LLM class flavin-dependent oxidoreductase n=1 Tax=Kineosporia corallincola TaxID=2835133 RepID=A0ABS5TFX1_9ACTN|nr:LLM class flavin-dependent oxidoreductase [Kineosporia corallincola]MBT0769985.1 LLM class flavin-dependent oxidoreductase [Kineosporia corallincola]